MNDVTTLKAAHAETWARARKFYPSLPETAPPIVLDLTGRTAGMVKFRGERVRRGFYKAVRILKVRYNPAIMRDNANFVSETVPHELAHVVALLLDGNGTHDATWRHICQQLGGQTRRTHTYEVAAKEDKRKRVTCGCPDGILVGPVQYKRIAAGARRYSCRRCGERLFA